MRKTIKLIMLMALTVLALLTPTAGNAQTLYGYSRTYGATGLLTINPSATTDATLISSNIQPTAGAIKDSTMYIVGFDDDFNTLFYSVDLTTGKATKIKTLPESVGSPMDMSYNYNDDKMYFVTNSDNDDVATSKLCTIDLTTGVSSVVKSDLGFFVRAMAISTDGTMYYVTRDGVLYTYDIATGTNTEVGTTGYTPRGTFGSLGFDRLSGKLYWATELSDSYVNNLYSINMLNGSATLLGVIGNTSNGEGYFTVALDAPFVPAPLAAPQKVDSLTATAGADGALQVDLAWVNPDSTVNEAALETIDSVVVMRGEQAVATLTDMMPGAQATYTDMPDSAGTYRYHVLAYNAAGASADRYVDVYVGHDVPGAVLLPLADLYGANEVANVLTWHAPEQGAHGGWIDSNSLTYTVKRLNDGKILADKQTFEADDKGMMTLKDSDLQQLLRYTYAITASTADGDGVEAETNFIVNGPAVKIDSVYEADFNNEADAMLWTPFDANGDGYTFEWHSYSVLSRNLYIYQAHPTNYAADFLITPPMEMQEGHEYTITVTAANSFAPYPEAFTVSTMGGNAPHGAVVGQPLTDPVTVSHPDSLAAYTFKLSKIADDGQGTDHDKFVTFLAIYCESDPNMDMFLTGGFRIVDQTIATGMAPLKAVSTEEAQLYTVGGVLVAKGKDIRHAAVAPGIYILKEGAEVKKIQIK